MAIEKAYITEIKKGNELAFKNLMNFYSSDLFYYAFSIVHSKEASEEIVSDAFFELWKKRKSIDELKNLKTWLLVVTQNKAISYLRKESKNNFLSIDDLDDFLFDPIQSPDYEMINKEELDNINKAIEKLPPRCKQVFFLAKIELLPYKEIADMLGISVKTINNHIAYALEIIAKAMK
ncbi:RNA polymerase sigma factor [Parabacteroides sp. Marseille-P3160]|uniref:RNA polymerase sigma factor n=1 Tax=Parabacteroides sp. Marseille-P3160 TaxID=1917887 RepID=UPI0009BC51D5|nr:RNA polymerase sigma-70 factor [Parabacteroides sp. Marseille-P3160]